MQTDHTDRAHAEFSPSGLKPIVACRGYIGREGTNAAAEKGTRIHEALEDRDPSALLDDEEAQIYRACIFGEEVALAAHRSEGQATELLREERLHIDLDGGLNTFGTIDLIEVPEHGDWATAIDYKTGKWPVDEPRENWQARAYSVGVFQKFPKVETVNFYFICPARDEILSGEFSRDELPVLKRMISKAIQRAMEVRAKWLKEDPDPSELDPNPDCQFCANQHMCPALGGIAIDIATSYSPEPLEIPKGTVHSSEIDDPKVLSQLFAIAKVLEKWVDSVKSHALKHVKEGHDLPGWKTRNMGAIKSVTDQNALRVLAKQFGVTDEELMHATSYKLTEIRKAVRQSGGTGKDKREQEFLEVGQSAGVIKVGAPRITLTKKTQ